MNGSRGYRSPNLERALGDGRALPTVARVAGARVLAATGREELRQLRRLGRGGFHAAIAAFLRALAGVR